MNIELYRRGVFNCWQSLGKWRESFCRTVAVYWTVLRNKWM